MNRKISTSAKTVKQMFTGSVELLFWRHAWELSCINIQNHNHYKRGEESLIKGKQCLWNLYKVHVQSEFFLSKRA